MLVVTRATLSTTSIRFYQTLASLSSWPQEVLSCLSPQESNVGKSSDEVNFALCYDDAGKDEIERLQHTISEIESENGCYRLLITRLEDELLMIRKSETRAVSHSLTIVLQLLTLCAYM
jgi:hypothetical protein